jgi:hypothetical protein
MLLGRYIIPYEVWFGASLIDMDRQQARRWLITRVFVSGMVDRNSLRSASELPYIDAELEDAYY